MAEELSESERSDLHMLYQVTAQDLAFFKSQQWAISNYSILLFAGSAGVAKISAVSASLCPKILILAVVAVAISAIYLLWRLEHSVQVRRERLKFVRTQLTVLFQQAWSAREKSDQLVLPVWVLTSAVVLSGGIACLVILAL